MTWPQGSLPPAHLRLNHKIATAKNIWGTGAEHLAAGWYRRLEWRSTRTSSARPLSSNLHKDKSPEEYRFGQRNTDAPVWKSTSLSWRGCKAANIPCRDCSRL